MNVNQDTGSEDNWISPIVLQSLGFYEEEDVQDAASVQFGVNVTDFSGREFKSSKVAILKWRGRKDLEGEAATFYVGPEGLPVDMLVGRLFLNEKGFDQFWEPEQRTKTLVVVSPKPKVSCVDILAFLFSP